MEEKEEVYIVVFRGGYFSSVTVCYPESVPLYTRQLRQGGLKVKVFRSREAYEKAHAKNHEEYWKNRRLQTRCGGYK